MMSLDYIYFLNEKARWEKEEKKALTIRNQGEMTRTTTNPPRRLSVADNWADKRKKKLMKMKYRLEGECQWAYFKGFNNLRDTCLFFEGKPLISKVIDYGVDNGRKLMLPGMGTAQSHGVIYGKTVDTSSGPIRGRVYEVDNEREVDAFLGIPYAEPPVGELRFKKPVPITNWSETIDCVHFGPRCPQTDEYFTGFLNIVGKDEAKCLTLNVFAPSWESEQYPNGYPIMVWIHGGGFTMHSSSNYGDRTLAKNLVAKDVMVVSINYRLGIFGFLCTGDDVCKGNLGLWDQTLALQWVRENAARFGGDASNITLFGQSAGGASVDLLSLSPHSRDLFHKVLPMAGCGECEFAIRSKEEQSRMSFEYAKYLGWKPANGEETSQQMFDFFHAQYSEVLELGISGRKGFGHPGQLYFTPNFDGDFFPKTIAELRKEAPRKPILCGVTQNEGLFFLGLSTFARTYDGMQKFASKIIREDNFENPEPLRKELLDYYMKGTSAKDKQEVIKRFVKLIGDFAINSGMFEYVKKETELGADVYMYTFDYCNTNGFGIVKWILPFLGATHCSELRYVLGKGVISKFRPNDDDLKMIDIMTTYFTNFAKTGNPNGDSSSTVWEKYRTSKPFRHLKITLTPTMDNDFLEKRPAYWAKIREANKSRANV